MDFVSLFVRNYELLFIPTFLRSNKLITFGAGWCKNKCKSVCKDIIILVIVRIEKAYDRIYRVLNYSIYRIVWDDNLP